MLHSTSFRLSLAVLLAGVLSAQSTNPQTQIQGQSKNGQALVSNGTYLRWNNAALDPTQFSGADIGAKVNAAFASFGAGKCGRVVIPPGTYTYSTTIYVPTGCILEGSGRANDQSAYGTRLVYDGAAATSAIVMMETNMSPAYFSTVRDLAVYTNATKCTNDGILTWQAASPDANKWKCYDGASYTTPTPHLAAIQHGQINPTTTNDGTHITIANVDINGGGLIGTSSTQQGGFHFGVFLNGCEECILQGVYAFQADDGFALGPAANGVLGLQLTARVNKRSGFHVRSQNNLTLLAPLMESNSWAAHGVTAGYGIGFLCDNENAAAGVCRATLDSAYFESNWLDVSIPTTTGFRERITSAIGGGGLQTFSGYINQGSILGGSSCTFDNGANVHVVSSGILTHNCTVTTGTIDKASNAQVFTMDATGVVPVQSDIVVGTTPLVQYKDIRPFANSVQWVNTVQEVSNAVGTVFTTDKAATAGTSVSSPNVGWVGRGWKTDATAGSQRVGMFLRMNAETGAANPKGWFEFRGKVNGADDYDTGSMVGRLSTGGELEVNNYVKPGSSAGAPATCASGIYGATYFNSTDARLCVCVNDGTDAAWVKSSDYTHATGHCTP